MNRLFPLAVSILPMPLLGQESISSERPSFSSSPFALDAGRWQLEGGLQYSRFVGDADGYSLPLGLLRHGITKRAEIQIGWTGYSRIDAGAGDVDGLTDASVGMKWQLADDSATTPVALFAGLSLPVGADALSSDDVDPTLGLFWAHNGRVPLFGTVLASESGGDTSLGGALGINLPAARLCGSCSAYVEYFGIWPEGQGPAHTLNGGILWLSHNDLQFDLNLGVGLNDRAGDAYFGGGVAYRFR